MTFEASVHLSLVSGGQQEAPTGGVGSTGSACNYWVRTEDDDGVIHIRAPHFVTPTLATFFAIWDLAIPQGSGNSAPFRDAAEKGEITVNDVAVLDGASAVVLRGTAQSSMEIWNLPSQRRDEVVSARQGDRIALALDGTDFSPPIPANAVAWINGEPPGSDFETVDVGDVFAIAGRDPGDPSIYPPGEPWWGSLVMLLPIAAGLLLAVFIGWRRLGRRSPDDSR